MNRQGTGSRIGLRVALGLVVWLALGWAVGVHGQTGADDRPGARTTAPMPQDGRTVSITVPLNKSQVLEFPRAVRVVSIGNPDVADVVVMRARQIYVLGKSLGTTNVVLWDESERVQGVLNVEVTHDLETLKGNLHEMLPGEPIEVRSAQGSLILSGAVTSKARMDAALRLANSYAEAGRDKGGTSVLNLMQVGGAQQVMLDVKVAEVSRSLIKRLGIQFNAFDAGAPWQIGAVKGGATFPGGQVSASAPDATFIEDMGLFARYQSGDFLLNIMLEAAHREGVAKILAEPNLTTLTGQEAHFLAGGEFPIPVPQDLGRITIEHKEFGVGLRFLPVVLDSGVINLKVDVSVSDLLADGGITLGLGDEVSPQFFIPALVKRSASSTVELGSGQTIAIAGMINENTRDNVSKFPGLGDLPIIGALFRSQEFVKDQTELVIFVTPRLARPITPEQARLPTGSFVAPSDLKFYLLGRLPWRGSDHDSNRRERDPLSNRRDGGTAGRFGHDL